jgi:hypothetical protein
VTPKGIYISKEKHTIKDALKNKQQKEMKGETEAI